MEEQRIVGEKDGSVSRNKGERERDRGRGKSEVKIKRKVGGKVSRKETKIEIA